MSSKFKVGDHVVVVDSSDYGDDQVGLVGTIVEVKQDGILPIEIVYENSKGGYKEGSFNTYKDSDLEHTPIHNSPLMRALR